MNASKFGKNQHDHLGSPCPKAAPYCSTPTVAGVRGSLQPGIWAVGKLGLTEQGMAAKVNGHLTPSPGEPSDPNLLVLGWDISKGHPSSPLKQVPMSKLKISFVEMSNYT